MQGFHVTFWSQHVGNSLVDIHVTIWFVHTICHWVKCYPAYFMGIFKQFLYTDFDYGFLWWCLLFLARYLTCYGSKYVSQPDASSKCYLRNNIFWKCDSEGVEPSPTYTTILVDETIKKISKQNHQQRYN